MLIDDPDNEDLKEMMAQVEAVLSTLIYQANGSNVTLMVPMPGQWLQRVPGPQSPRPLPERYTPCWRPHNLVPRV